MSDYRFFAACLRFVARRTDAAAPGVAAMMVDLSALAEGIETAGALIVPAERRRSAARALAGVAGMLQQHILPEAVAGGDAAAEGRVRWMIDAAMAGVAELTVHAETVAAAEFRAPLPPPP
ncbi:conserved hypothetical protein [uncultured Alphaproteobacteria bacterium]|uniref:Uncharacterized protein n=1 Tax=uncultured Alphaproteobacteria bacterium TaxID=91750 RepID=A0A212JF82_9PROT|nr:conserved hypothetical protein [uncultured Alphaproteobacteria bacterium]